MEQNKQKEDFIRRLLAKDDDKDEGNKIRARAYYFDFNAPRAGFEYKRTRIAST